jgi:hypothetical protein
MESESGNSSLKATHNVRSSSYLTTKEMKLLEEGTSKTKSRGYAHSRARTPMRSARSDVVEVGVARNVKNSADTRTRWWFWFGVGVASFLALFFLSVAVLTGLDEGGGVMDVVQSVGSSLSWLQFQACIVVLIMIMYVEDLISEFYLRKTFKEYVLFHFSTSFLLP